MSQIPFKPLSKFALEVIQQLWTGGPIWDGYIITKTGRDELVSAGLCDRCEGFNFLTKDGVRVMARRYRNIMRRSRDERRASMQLPPMWPHPPKNAVWQATACHFGGEKR